MARQPAPIYVITLARSADRRSVMHEQMARAGLSCEWIEGRDGERMADGDPELEPTTRAHPGLRRPLTRGEVACALSHLDVLERVRDGAAPWGCVLEDDVELSADAASVLAAMPADLSRVADLVLLGHHSARRPPALGAFTCVGGIAIGGRRIARVAEFAMGAYGYAVTRRGAERLIAHARPLRMPWDWVTGYAPAAGVQLCAVTPPCVTPRGGVSDRTTIEGREAGYTAAPDDIARPALRSTLGNAALLMRRLGIATDSYVKKF